MYYVEIIELCSPYPFLEQTLKRDLTQQPKYLGEQLTWIHLEDFYFHRKLQFHFPAL